MSINWISDWLNGAEEGWVLSWLGEDEDLTVIPGSGPEGAATFALELRDGYTVTYSWRTNVIKARGGKEQRISRNDSPKENYEGSVLLFGASAAALRSTFARRAHIGEPFLLGLPHEGLSMRLASSGTTVYVHDTQYSDWLNPGQRVVVRWMDPDDPEDTEEIEAVVQSSTSNTIVLDVEPGDAGALGAVIMPLRPILLESEQAFPRYPTRAERWEVRAKALSMDFAIALHSLDLGPLTTHAGLENARIVQRYSGAPITFYFSDDIEDLGNVYLYEGVPGEVGLYFDATGGPFAGSVEEAYAALLTSTRVQPAGTWGTGNLTVGDVFAPTLLSGGETQGPFGNGATVNTYASHPIWDRPIETDGEIVDSIQAMTEILDYGGVPDSVGSADQADWGRAVNLSGELGADLQWLKLFMAAVKGGQKSFWLSTYRDDLPFVSKATNTITVEADIPAWYPSQRQHVEIEETSGTITRAEITGDAVNNGDGTYTLTIETTLASSSVERVSWLEFCRFTGDEFKVRFDDKGWTLL